ncbi:YgfZ/GcvT domain-containing protein [Agitococcus lubricus]|uniref:Uncharacterized protein n=1 Tax=Agitococcus lubricus TaxID=1077255 RepID=A0A2T5J082_9GAMM|nr:folate-binding protein YgfZ [Agitococcus lubricus]PTQ89737.1 hypothetical protein C8N29_10561 [Agitococcus lubricus]
MSALQIIRLDNEHIFTIHGVDAHKFLQGQTTTDIQTLTPQHACLGGYANLKGRLVFSFNAVEWPAQHIQLLVDRELSTTAQNTLKKYMVFSKAQLTEAPLVAFGVMGTAAYEHLHAICGDCPTDTRHTYSTAEWSITRLHGEHRWLILVTADAAESLWSQLNVAATVATLNDWRLAQIRAGETPVLAQTSELYQPQELNYLNLDAISYNKGCYTGQEIIARLYFRGKLKQWAHRFSVQTAHLPALNTPLYDREGQSQGHVVLAAQASPDTVELLAIARHDKVSHLFLGEEKKSLDVLDLPYVVAMKD